MSGSRPTDAVAIVTGASGGIGRATALRLALDGIPVLAVGRDTDRLTATSAGTHLITPLGADLASSEGITRVVDTAAALGQPLILVHCAGRGGYADAPIWELSFDSWRATLAVNLDAAFLLLRQLSAHMVSGGWGRAVIVGSTAGDVPAGAQAAYSASKSGVMGLVRSAAVDLGAIGATCNAVLPGWVQDSLMADEDARYEAERRGLTVERVWEERAAAYPDGRVVDPAEVADVIAFLVSDASRGVNGEGIRVTHGAVW